MIQRIQTLYLLIGSICLFLLIPDFSPFGTLDTHSDTVLAAATDTGFSDGIFTVSDHLLLLLAVLAGGVIALAAVFLYSNRSLQAKLVAIFIMLATVTGILGGYLLYKDVERIRSLTDASSFGFGFGSILPLAAALLGYLALRGIRKDDKLVRSMDRLR